MQTDENLEEKNFEEYLVRKYKPKYNSVLGRRHIHFKRV